LKAKRTSILQIWWDFFCSLKLAITTLILLAVTSIIGTVLPQTKTPQENLQLFGETKFKLFDALDFFDMYHSWWFLSLLALFSINLICCSIKRLPRIWKIVSNPVLTPDETLYRTFSNTEEYLSTQSVSELKEPMKAFLGKTFARPTVTEVDGKVHFFAQKMPWARFSVYVTHLSILIIFIGAIIGTVAGYKAYVNVPEGGSTDQVWPRGSNQPLKLGFEVFCDRFDVEFYPGSQRPKDYVSDLRVVDNGQEVVKKTIEVNDPLTYKGLTFYQSSYGPMGEPQFTFKVTRRASGETVTLTGRQGQLMELPGGKAFRVADFTEAYQNLGAAARIEVLPGMVHQHQAGESHPSFIVLKAFPEFDARRGGEYSFSLLDLQQRYYTGLQVAKDPGVWVVWTGCFLLVFGCMAAFFLSHRRVWLTLQEVDGQTGIKVGGSAHRNQPGFEIFFDEFKDKLKAELDKHI
jgi:cytochrome c biogenesis protein